MSDKDKRDDNFPSYLVSNLYGNTIFYNNDTEKLNSMFSDDSNNEEELKEIERDK